MGTALLAFAYGVRPAELAERCFMTKQAMNYLLRDLEDRGYIERRAEKAGTPS